MVDTHNVSSITPFVVILTTIWVGVAVLLWSFSEFEFPLYYMLIYVLSLGILELASSLQPQLSSQKWLNRAVIIGFLGWILGMLLYLR